MSRPKLLFLCQTLPFPPDGGVAIRSYNILRLLANHYDVTALCFYRRAVMRDVEASLAALRQIASRVEAFPIEQEHRKLRLLVDHLASVTSGRVYTVRAYESRSFRHRLCELLSTEAFQLVHVDSLDLSAYLPLLSKHRVICVHHNVESALLARRAAREPAGLRRRYIMHQSRLMDREERMWCARVALNVTVSQDDQEQLRRKTEVPVVVVPNGVDTDAFQPAPREGHGVVFVGGMTWFPNRDALEYFTADILPAIHASEATVPITWVGRASPGAAAEYARHGISLTGYVEDIRPYVYDAACYVVPLRVGGGTRLKILDAWAMGKTVVSTSIGCEGLEAVDGENIIIRDDPTEFASAVSAVLRDPALRDRIGRNARSTAERIYSWNVIDVEMFRAYELVRSGTVGLQQLPPSVHS